MREIDLYDTLHSKHATGESKIALREASHAVARAKKVVVISGAGISTSSGIPDFRSGGGLYATNGSSLFSSHVFNAHDTQTKFHKFVSTLHTACNNALPTNTHHFIGKLASKGKLVRSYTQNIDGMESRVGLQGGSKGKNVELHGNIALARCRLCMVEVEMKREWIEKVFSMGDAPNCPVCEERSHSRSLRNARSTSIGTLRPAIVLYDEDHPSGWEIGQLAQRDLNKSPDLMIILGTSLKVHGLKNLVKDFIKEIHAEPNASPSSSKKQIKKRGTVIFVNKTPPAKEWASLIDVYVQGETDMWVEKVERDWRAVKPGDWEKQAVLDVQELKTASARKSQKPSRTPLQPIHSINGGPDPRVPLPPLLFSSNTPTGSTKRKRADDDDLKRGVLPTRGMSGAAEKGGRGRLKEQTSGRSS